MARLTVRGELWTISAGTYASKPRPALIIQDDAFTTDSVTLIPLTTTMIDAPLLRLPLSPTIENGLQLPSWIMIDKLTTARRTHLGDRIGQITTAQMWDVERLVATFLGFAR